MRNITLVLTSLFFIAVQLLAQSAQQDTRAAALAGTVLDQTGKAIQNAAVVVKNESSGLVLKTTTDEGGRFSAAGLAAGVYTIEASAPGFAKATRAGMQLAAGGAEDISISLTVAPLSQEVTVEAAIADSVASQVAPSQSSLEARTAKSEIGEHFIRNFISPVADFSDVVQMAPGTFSVQPNGAGLGDTKIFFRGFKNGFYTMTFDGIPFNDTNDPTQHSWAMFPSQWIGGTVFDRSPGSATTIGPANFGGSVNLLSRTVPSQQNISGTVSYGSFNTRLLELDYDSGQFGGAGGKSSLLIDFHQMQSDGYQTYNYQLRYGGSAKYQYKLSDKTTLTAFTGVVDLSSNTPNQKGPTRAQVAQFGNNFLLSGDPSSPLYYRFSFYHIPTDFEYVGIKSNLGHGWSFENKSYTYRYYNKQNYNGLTSITATSATDKLNSYRKAGDTMAWNYEFRFGVLRTGLWYEYAWTDRFQAPSDPRTWVDAALPNFHEKFGTTTAQPFAEYSLSVTRKLSLTGGIKLASYRQNFTQYADNGKTVGCLSGVLSGPASSVSTTCLNGNPFVTHVTTYNSWLPAASVHYFLKNNWSVYGQFATGNVIPPTSVFDVKNALVSVLPKPTLTRTYQVGSVWKIRRLTLDVDAFRSHFENPYSSSPDPATGEPVYFLTGASVTKGVEAESTVFIASGISVYLNATADSAKYVSSGLWVQNAPKNTETVGLTYQRKNWDMGFFNKRVGTMYNDNGSTNQAVTINPFNITNVFFNYTVKSQSHLNGTKFRVGINNILDKHSIVGVTPASTATSVPAPGDQLALMAGRSVSFSMTFGYAPNR